MADSSAADVEYMPDWACTDNFDEFADNHPSLLDKEALLHYYSDELLNGQRARTEWVEPDLRALP